MSGCGLNQFFITMNIILAFVASVISIHPRVQEENPQSGLPQAAAVTGMFLGSCVNVCISILDILGV